MVFVATHLAVVEGGHLSIVLGFKSPLLATVWPPTGHGPFWQWHCSSSCCCSGCHWANSFSSKLELTVHERGPSGGYHQWVTTNNSSSLQNKRQKQKQMKISLANCLFIRLLRRSKRPLGVFNALQTIWFLRIVCYSPATEICKQRRCLLRKKLDAIILRQFTSRLLGFVKAKLDFVWDKVEDFHYLTSLE